MSLKIDKVQLPHLEGDKGTKWSTLEVATLQDSNHQIYQQSNHSEHEQVTPLSPESDVEKEVTYEHEKEIVPEDIGKQVMMVEGKEVPIEEAPELLPSEAPLSPDLELQLWWKRKQFLAPFAVLLVVIIIAATIGGILGSKKHSNSNEEATGSVQLENVAWRRNIAAIPSFENQGGWLRVYYLDNKGEIVESVRSADGASWKGNRLGYTALNGSALAVARSDMHFPAEIRIVYTNPLGILTDILWTPTSPKWTPGLLSSQNYIPQPNSGISTLYHQCYEPTCSNTALIAFLDMNSNVQVANQTTTGWSLSQLKVAYNISGSALAMHGIPLCMPDSFCADEEHSGEDQVALFYQQGNGEVGMTSWAPGGNFTTYSDTKTPGWASNVPFNSKPHAAPHSSPIASAGWFPADTSVWLFLINTLFLSSTDSIVIDTFGIFSNSSTTRGLRSSFTPPAMLPEGDGKGEYISLAVARSGFALGVWKGGEKERDLIKVWRVEEDGVSWSANGTVDTMGFW